ncbi:MAG: hypothetical protein GX334_05825 [Firmicutes bacterium]|nr:hypothetical protein [Bacillota bacterium]
MAHHFGFIFNPLNTCLTCGSRDFLETAIVGETLSIEKLAAGGIHLDVGEEVFICFNCLLEFCL